MSAINNLQICQALGDLPFFDGTNVDGLIGLAALAKKFPEHTLQEVNAAVQHARGANLLEFIYVPKRAIDLIDPMLGPPARFQVEMIYLADPGRHLLMTLATGKAARSILDEIDGKGPKCAL